MTVSEWSGEVGVQLFVRLSPSARPPVLSPVDVFIRIATIIETCKRALLTAGERASQGRAGVIDRHYRPTIYGVARYHGTK